MTRMTELILEFYNDNGIKYIKKETIALMIHHYGVGELTVIYPNETDRRISLESIDTPIIQIEKHRVSMFVEGDSPTQKHVVKCIEAYEIVLEQEINKIEKLINDLKKEAEIWNFEKINQKSLDRNKSL